MKFLRGFLSVLAFVLKIIGELFKGVASIGIIAALTGFFGHRE